MKSWSGMRRYLEDEMLADALKGRVQYICTTYPNMDGCGQFEIRVDGNAVKRFSMETLARYLYGEEKPVDRDRFWQAYWVEKERGNLTGRAEFDDVEFADALCTYRRLDIADALHAENPLVRMLAVLDRRAGKRTLVALKDTVGAQPAWLQYFYRLRLEAGAIL